MNEGSGLKVGSTATWLNNLGQHPNSHVEGGDGGQSLMGGFSTQHSHGSTIIDHSSAGQGRGLLDLHSDTANSSDLLGSNRSDGEHHPHQQDHNSEMVWHSSRLKADILQHPLYDQLLDSHVACLRIATPVDQLPKM